MKALIVTYTACAVLALAFALEHGGGWWAALAWAFSSAARITEQKRG